MKPDSNHRIRQTNKRPWTDKASRHPRQTSLLRQVCSSGYRYMKKQSRSKEDIRTLITSDDDSISIDGLNNHHEVAQAQGETWVELRSHLGSR